MGSLFNRARMTVSGAPGTGTITLGAAASAAFFTFAEAGVPNATVVSYVIEDGTNVEIGNGTYTSSGTTLSRDTVTASKIGGVAGTTKLTLTSAAVVYIDALAADVVPYTGKALLVGTQTPAVAEAWGSNTLLGVYSSDPANPWAFGHYSYNTGGYGAGFHGSMSRGTTMGAHAIVQNNDWITTFYGLGSNGTGFVPGGGLNVLVDGVPVAGAGSVPTSVSISSSDAAGNTREGLWVRASGTVEIPSTTASSSTTTGALTVVGGAGIGGALYVGNGIYSRSGLAVLSGYAGDINKGLLAFNQAGTQYIHFDATNFNFTAPIVTTGSIVQTGPGHWGYGSPGAGSFYSTSTVADRFFLGTDSGTDNFRLYSAGSASNAIMVNGATGAASFTNNVSVGGTSTLVGDVTLGGLIAQSAGPLNGRQTASAVLQEAFGLSPLAKVITANVAYTNNTSVQPWFPSGGTLTPEAATTYEIEGQLHVGTTSTTTAHTISLLFGGTASLTSINYTAEAWHAVINTTASAATAAIVNLTTVNQAAATVVTATSGTTSALVTTIKVRGIIRVSGAGTLIPQFSMSAGRGAGNVLANTFFKLRKLGSNTVVNQGAWA